MSNNDRRDVVLMVGYLLLLVAGIVLLRVYGVELGPGCR